MQTVLAILFGAAFTAACSYACGRALLRRIPLASTERTVLSFVIGSALLSHVVFVLTATGLAYTAAFAITGGLALASTWFTRPTEHAAEPPPLPRLWKTLFAAVFAVYALMYLPNAMAPETSPDGTAYHLGLVSQYLRTHTFGRITTNMYASLSEGIEMLFLFAFAFGKHSAASMVHFTYLLALPVLVLSYARRIGEPVAGVVAGVLLFASPIIGLDGTIAYIDVAAACILFTVFYLLQIWDESRDDRLLIPIGVVAGFAYGVKYTAFLAVPYALGFVLWRSRSLRRVFVTGAVASVWILPWMIKNWIVVSNPLAPFFNHWFRNPYVYVEFERTYRYMMGRYEGLESYWHIPWEACVRGGVLQGIVGPIFLIAPIALLVLNRQQGRRLLFAWVLFTITYASNVGARFLIPSLPFLAVAIALAVARVPQAAMAIALLHAVFSYPDLNRLYCHRYAWRLPVDPPIKAALRIKPEAEYLRERLYPRYDFAQYIEAEVPADSRILTFQALPEAYCTRQILVGYQSALANRVGDYLYVPLHHEVKPTKVMRFSFPQGRHRVLRLRQTEQPEEVEWSVTEWRIFDGDREVNRRPEWRIRAWPNPWTVQDAFDNSLISRWRTREFRTSGAWLEVDLGRPEQLDALELQTPHAQSPIKLALEAQAADGRWVPITDSYAVSEVQMPAGLRAAAMQEIKANGIDYLFLMASDFGYKEIGTNVKPWGLTLVKQIGDGRLYRID